MALPFPDELKAYSRVTTDVEDDLFQQITDTAYAWVTAYYGVPLNAVARTFKGVWPRVGAQRQDDTRMIVPVRPCDATASITDAAGTTVDSTTYYIDQRSGYIEAKRAVVFSNPPYDIVIDVGWGVHPEYTANIEPILRQAILWAGSMYYRNRNSGAIYEQSGGQVSITYTEKEIPPALLSLMRTLKDHAWFA